MATKYFNDAEANGDWNDAGNWWMNDDGTGATTKPTTSDDAILLAVCTDNNGDPAVCNTLAIPDAGNAGHNIQIEVTTIAGATFSGNSYNGSTVSGVAVFNGSSYNDGAVNGGAVFNDSSYNAGTCDTAVYSATAAAHQLANNIQGTVSGSCTVRIGVNGSSILGLP
jgi:hypothetical protein